MSSLNVTEQRYIEKVLDMGNGYVLDFTDATFGAFFKGHGIEIHGNKYLTYGTSEGQEDARVLGAGSGRTCSWGSVRNAGQL